jgi:hypothetical protein
MWARWNNATKRFMWRGVEYRLDYSVKYREPRTYFSEWDASRERYVRVDRPPLYPNMLRIQSDAWQFNLILWRFGFYAYDAHERSWVGAVYRWFERRHAEAASLDG